jgi:threonine dehydrogenase-like Zn-dependent dehydrogenase
VEPTDAIARLAATCICGSDLWPYRGVEALDGPRPMGHEYAGVVEEAGCAVTSVRPGQFVVGSFFASDNTCEICRSGHQSSCVRREAAAPGGAQAQRMRVPLADGTLVATPDTPPDDLVPSLLLALEFGATDIVTERGDAGVAAVKDLTSGLGAHSVIEAVGTQESMMQAIHATRPGGHVGYVGVTHNVALPGMELFFSHVHLHGPAPVRQFLPDLIDRIWTGQINPGKVFDLELALDQTAAGYRAMDRREAIKVLLRP